MNKKLIILSAIIGILGFSGMFAFSWFTAKPAPETGMDETQAVRAENTEGGIEPIANRKTASAEDLLNFDSEVKKAMTEKQLKNLIYEIREKVRAYEAKLKDLDLREQRLGKTQNVLKQDIEKMNNLRIELASAVANLKSEQEKLKISRVAIEKTERNNLMALATAYDKMASDSAGEILVNINKSKSSNSEDAIKILYYMQDRTKAKVLASIAQTEPAVSAYFCQKLKQVEQR